MVRGFYLEENDVSGLKETVRSNEYLGIFPQECK